MRVGPDLGEEVRAYRYPLVTSPLLLGNETGSVPGWIQTLIMVAQVGFTGTGRSSPHVLNPDAECRYVLS